MPLGISGILFLDLGQKYTCVETKHVKDADDQKQKKVITLTKHNLLRNLKKEYNPSQKRQH